MKTTLWKLRSFFAIALVLCLALGSMARGRAQAPKDADTKTVRLMLGEVTMDALVKDIVAQSGAKITLARYLRDRKVVVYMESTTVKEALLSIADLHGWRLTNRDASTFRIERKTASPETDPVSISVAMQRSFPSDIQVFFGYDTDDLFRPKGIKRTHYSLDTSNAILSPRIFTDEWAKLIAPHKDKDAVAFLELGERHRNLLQLVMLTEQVNRRRTYSPIAGIPIGHIRPDNVTLSAGGGTQLVLQFLYPGGQVSIGTGLNLDNKP